MLPVSPSIIQMVLGTNSPLVSASPVMTIEPRRRQFHTAINLTVPAPETTVSKPGKPARDGSKLHLLYSITGKQLLIYCLLTY